MRWRGRLPQVRGIAWEMRRRGGGAHGVCLDGTDHSVVETVPAHSSWAWPAR